MSSAVSSNVLTALVLHIRCTPTYTHLRSGFCSQISCFKTAVLNAVTDRSEALDGRIWANAGLHFRRKNHVEPTLNRRSSPPTNQPYLHSSKAISKLRQSKSPGKPGLLPASETLLVLRNRGLIQMAGGLSKQSHHQTACRVIVQWLANSQEYHQQIQKHSAQRGFASRGNPAGSVAPRCPQDVLKMSMYATCLKIV